MLVSSADKQDEYENMEKFSEDNAVHKTIMLAKQEQQRLFDKVYYGINRLEDNMRLLPDVDRLDVQVKSTWVMADLFLEVDTKDSNTYKMVRAWMISHGWKQVYDNTGDSFRVTSYQHPELPDVEDKAGITIAVTVPVMTTLPTDIVPGMEPTNTSPIDPNKLSCRSISAP